jgi:hypothetical protein
VIALAALALMAGAQAGHRRRIGRQRRATLAEAERLLDDVVVEQDGIGYPSLSGRYRGDRIRIELVVDTLTLRQLPRLWLMLTVLRPLAVRAPVDILLRPQSSDIVSPGVRFAYEHPIPADWPPHMRIATEVSGPLPDLDGVDAIRVLLREPSTKDLLVAPGGVRIVHELERGAVGAYRVQRRPQFDARLEPARLVGLLESLREIADAFATPSARPTIGAL